jgi:ABC-type branched-subunit amino acid transport system substrate-binding protein
MNLRNARFTLLSVAAAVALSASPAWAQLKVGFNVPLTGFAAADGKSALEGAKLAVAQANAKGGVAGQKIELVVYDDQATAKEAVPSATRMVEKDNVVVAVSGSYSGSTRAAATIFQRAQIPYVVAYAIHPDITMAGDYMFRVSAMGEVQGRGGAKLVQNLGKKRVLLVTLKNDFGQALAAGFKDAAPKLGLSIIFAVYALAMIITGISKKLKHIRMGGIILFGITLCKVLFYDLSALSTISKTIVLIVLGIIMLIASFLYNKFKDSIFGNEAETMVDNG